MSQTSSDTATPGGKPSPVLIIFLIIPLLGIMAAVGIGLANNNTAQTIPTPLPVAPPAEESLVDKAAPNFELAALDGKTLRLSNYRGRVVFVNFWATWCEPCQRELPAFQQFAQEQGQNGPAILAVNVGEPADPIKTYLADHDLDGILALLDTDLKVYEDYGIDRLPTTYVIDPAGIVRYKHYGEMTVADLAAYVNELSAS